MAGSTKPPLDGDLVTNASDTAREAASASRTANVLTVLVSLLALFFSGISLYQTVVKQAQLHVFVPPTISYTRDPDGSFEVFVIPITITNSGARDGIVTSLTLQARNMATGITKQLDASYFASHGYFSTKEDLAKNVKRPKTPFAPLSVPGRGDYSGTILFYPRKFARDKVIPGKGRFELTLTAHAQMSEHFGFLDQLWSTNIKPLTAVYELPKVSRYFEGRMLVGHTARLFRAAP